MPTPEPADSARRRWVIPAIAVAAVALMGGGLAAAGVFGGGESTGNANGANASGDNASGIGATSESAAGDTDESSGRHMLIEELPDGWTVNGASDSIFDGYAIEGQVILFAGADATSADGPWLAIEVTGTGDAAMTAETTAATIVGGGGGGGGGGDGPAPLSPVDINGVKATRGTTFEGADSISFRTNAGEDVRIASRGVSAETAVAVARALQFNVDGDGDGGIGLGIGASDLTDDLPPIYRSSGTGNLASAAAGFDFQSGYAPVSAYYTDGGDGNVSLGVAAIDRDGTGNPLDVARVLLVDPVETTVDDLPAVVGTNSTDQTVMTWVTGDHVVTLTGTITVEAMATMAASVRPATVAEWDELIDISQFGGVDARTAANSLLVGAGDFQDRSDWSVVAATSDGPDGDGGIEVCLEAQYQAFCDPVGLDELPMLTATARTQRYVGIIAVMPPGSDGAMLRITRGTDVTDIALADIASLPGPGAGWAAEATTAFTAELVEANGTVLATLTNSDIPVWVSLVDDTLSTDPATSDAGAAPGAVATTEVAG